MRTTFIEQLILEARSNEKIFLVVGDLGYSVVEPFAREFPSRFLNAGIAEQNMTGVAAGLASEGFHVFTYSIANFPTFRCAEQIRNDIAYHNLPVTVVSVGGGLAYGALGYSHHAVQDLALLRTLPSVLLAAPGDPAETRACLKYLSAHPQPSYLRLGKAGEPKIHASDPSIEPGMILHVGGDEGAKRLVLTTGATLKVCSEALATGLVKDWEVGSLPLWSEESKSVTAAALSHYETIVTVEDHLRSGGFGSYVQELLSDANCSTRIRCMALSSDICGHVGSQSSLNQLGGLAQDAIIESCSQMSSHASRLLHL